MPSRDSRDHLKGFTIVECVMAIMMCSLVLCAAYPLLTSSTRSLYMARDHYVATTISLAQIERVRDIPYDQLTTALSNDVQVRVNEMGAVDPSGRFRRTTTVQSNIPDPGLTTVKVETGIMDRKSGEFKTEKEVIEYIFTEYLTPVEQP